MASTWTPDRAVRMRVMVAGALGGLVFGALTGLLYNASEPQVVGALVGLGAGLVAGRLWSNWMIPFRRRHAGPLCLAAGSGLGILLGVACSLIVHLTYLVVIGLATDATSPAAVSNAAHAPVGWLTSTIPAGLFFGAYVGLIVGMLGTSKLIDEFPRSRRRSGTPQQDDPT